MPSTLVVGSNTYVTRAEANTYLGDQIHSATLWTALSDDNKDLSLLTAFNALNLLGLVEDGVAIDPADAPTNVKRAQMELAFAYSQDPTLANGTGHEGQNIKSAKAGSAEVEYFRPLSPKRFPTLVRLLLANYMPTPATNISGSASGGTGVCSEFDAADTYGRSAGFH